MTDTKNLRWNRHTDTCSGVTATGKACQGCGSDPASRQQRQAYALLVTLALTGGRMVCPLTGGALVGGQVEVDRVDPALGYVPGNVVLLSTDGNQGRSALQATGSDLPNVSAYRAAVTAASARVSVPATGSESSAIVARLGKVDRVALVLNGPYGR
jgi:hypothetical protein